MPALNFMAAILGIFAFPLTIYFYFKPRPVSKKILYGSKSIVLLPSPPRLTDLQITYRGEEIESLYMTRIVLWNAGDDVIKGRDDFYPEDRLRIAFEKPSLNIEAKILYISDGRKRVRPNYYPHEKNSHPEGILIDFDFLDPGQGLAIQVMHQNPHQAFKIEGRMTNSHRNKIIESQVDVREGNFLISFVYNFRAPFAICLGIILYATFSHALIILLGYLAVLLNLLSAEHFDFIRNGGGSALNPERESFLVIVSVAISVILTAAIFGKTRNFLSKKLRDVARVSLNMEPELLRNYQSSTWPLNGQDISN
ncbi:MAG: hypothetical protein ACFCVB_00020 [Nodosilinea sp.]